MGESGCVHGSIATRWKFQLKPIDLAPRSVADSFVIGVAGWTIPKRTRTLSAKLGIAVFLFRYVEIIDC